MLSSLLGAATRNLVSKGTQKALCIRLDCRGLAGSARGSEGKVPQEQPRAPTSGKKASVAPVPTELLSVIEETIKVRAPSYAGAGSC